MGSRAAVEVTPTDVEFNGASYQTAQVIANVDLQQNPVRNSTVSALDCGECCLFALVVAAEVHECVSALAAGALHDDKRYYHEIIIYI
jgi:hypothetical protein